MIALGWLVLAVACVALVALAIAATWRRPALAVGVFAVGLAIHNTAIMLLLRAGTPALIVRIAQAWKEILVALLVVRAIYEVVRIKGGIRVSAGGITRGFGPTRALDVAAIAFAGLLAVYFVAPLVSSFGADTSMAQRLLSLRVFVLIPVLYGLGRRFGAGDPGGTLGSVRLIVIAAVGIACVGILELWFLRTRYWIDLGVNGFTAWQGFSYHGPGGLPENFFQSTVTGYGLRRMVSTYISPLGVAYTGLLVVPLIVGGLLAIQRRRGWAWMALALVLISIALSVTRLAVLCLIAEAVLWVVVTRRPMAAGAGALAVVALVISFSLYPLVGPLVRFDLTDVRPPAGAALIGSVIGEDPSVTDVPPPSNVTDPDIVGGIVTQQDASIQAHILAVKDGLIHAVEHPLGIGLGTTMPRFGTPTGPAESALLGIVGEIGVLGGVLFLVLYCGVIALGFVGIARGVPSPFREIAFLVAIGGIGLAPVVLTSAVWGDFSVTFLFWWAAGALVSAAGRREWAGSGPIAAPNMGDPRP